MSYTTVFDIGPVAVAVVAREISYITATNSGTGTSYLQLWDMAEDPVVGTTPSTWAPIALPPQETVIVPLDVTVQGGLKIANTAGARNDNLAPNANAHVTVFHD